MLELRKITNCAKRFRFPLPAPSPFIGESTRIRRLNAPLRCNFSLLSTTPCRGLSQGRITPDLEWVDSCHRVQLPRGSTINSIAMLRIVCRLPDVFGIEQEPSRDLAFLSHESCGGS